MQTITSLSFFARPVALSALLAFCLVNGFAALGAEAGDIAEEPAQGTGPSISYHKMTAPEAAQYISAMGVRDPSADYNVLVDGHGTGKAPPATQDYDSLAGSLNVLDSIERTALPASFDLSASPSFPAVGNQGIQGSCTAWAATYYAYGYMEAVDQGWTQAKAGDASHLLSPAWTYNKVNGGIDMGSWEFENMMVLKDWGAPTMATMPYDQSDWTDWGSPAAFREAPLHRVYEAFRIPYEGAITVDTVKTLIFEGTPVTFGIDANEYGKGFADGNYILSGAEYNSRHPNHANTFVGYDDSKTDDGEIGAFKVVNSWGSWWGDAGYYWLTYEAFMEIGSWDLLDLAFVQDIEDYSPSMRAVWHLDPAPSRDAEIAVGIGTYSAPVQTKHPYYWLSSNDSLMFPTYMCVDITELRPLYDSGVEDFFLSLNVTGAPGTISGLKVELFGASYDPAAPTQSSGEAWNDPHTVPGHVDVAFSHYAPIGLAEALDSTTSLASEGNVRWVGVDHEWSLDGDSAQSGNIGDLEESLLTAQVLGPTRVSFAWKVSSETSGDYLSFEVDGIELAAISGDVDWESRSFELGTGTHVISWAYSKDDSGSELDDCGWVDNLRLSEPPVAYFEFSPLVGDVSTVFEFDATGSYDAEDPDTLLKVRWDWEGDGTWDTDWSGALVAYHTFATPGNHTVRLEVMDSDGLTDDFELQVTVHQLIPEFGALILPLMAAMTVVTVIAASCMRRRPRGPM
jgi:C1A family cysteine protease